LKNDVGLFEALTAMTCRGLVASSGVDGEVAPDIGSPLAEGLRSLLSGSPTFGGVAG
jgi:hypothetical protein